jgi:phosphoribosyl isomerase A
LTKTVAVFDYGSGNVHSACRALEHAGAEVVLTSDRKVLLEADGMLLPGVGAFASVMRNLTKHNAASLVDQRLTSGRAVLGICVGMQVMFEHGVEHGIDTEGLGQWPGSVTMLDAPTLPHIGWSKVSSDVKSVLFEGIEDERFYFVHSYAAKNWELDIQPPFVKAALTWSEHGERSWQLSKTVRSVPLNSTPKSPVKQVCSCFVTGFVPSRRNMKLELLPAVDVASGKAVRLTQGEAGSEEDFGHPLAAAQDWISAGAEWIHLVDLDAAFGRGDNRAVIAEVVGQAGSTKIELSGGIRDDASLAAALELGATRVNLGTAALENPEWTESVIAKYGDQIAVGLDVRGTTLAARGWTQEGGDLFEVLARLEDAGCSRYVVTDVTKDGTLRGPNLELLKQVMQFTNKPVVASGGISSLQDIKDLQELVPLGLEGAILGKSLYAGRFSLQEALAIANG